MTIAVVGRPLAMRAAMCGGGTEYEGAAIAEE